MFKGTEEPTLGVDSSVPLTHHDPKDLGLICLAKKRKIHFPILSDLKVQSWIFLKKRTLSILCKTETTSLKLPTTHHHFQLVDGHREEKYKQNQTHPLYRE